MCFWFSPKKDFSIFYSASLPPGVISKSGFQYGKFANNLFSILKLLVTVPKMGKIHHISNMTVWDKMAIFETTAKNSVLERWGPGPDLKYEKKMKKFDQVRILSQNHEIPLFVRATKSKNLESHKP